ncbi:N-acetylglucosamine-6-phosphate deacetylase [Woodsholea maritima]|uniref:N-acetylglucosamine-6-phosphate deacetylase n=1 Tax=Woodsholea maritima TaxID=240237 RepID=UPI00037E8979|nr:N-acetylglucosamine-6-phosphate deacetylase [Woodsholea maritima]
MVTRFTHGQILLPDGFSPEAEVEVHAGAIVAAGPLPPAGSDTEIIDLQGDYLVPGYIDVQVNGGGGVLFNDHPTLEGVRTIAAAHRSYGTTAMMPTLISDALSVVKAGIEAVDQAIEAGDDNILGIHIEGPFLSPQKCGIHDPKKFLVLDDEAVDILCSLKHGRTLVTIAPEMNEPHHIETLVKRGVIVALGHTNGRYEDAKAALAAGASGFTHLYNAMSPMQSRAPGVVGAAMENQNAYASVIVDGRHVDPVMLKLALKARPHDRFMLITDAMPNAGTDLDHFILQGRKIYVHDGECRDEDGVFAGASLTMDDAVKNSVALLDLSLEEAVRMASTYPARFLGLDHRYGQITPGAKAHLLRLNKAFDVVGVYSQTGWVMRKAA